MLKTNPVNNLEMLRINPRPKELHCRPKTPKNEIQLRANAPTYFWVIEHHIDDYIFQTKITPWVTYANVIFQLFNLEVFISMVRNNTRLSPN